MKKYTFILLALLVFSARAEEKSAPKITAGPYIQNCSQTEFTVVWQTDCDALSWVEVAPDDGTHFYNCTRSKFCQSIHGRRPVGRWHTVRVTGLEPGTAYRYRVLHKGVVLNHGNRRIRYSESKGSDVYRRQPYKVRTLDTTSNSTHFFIGNDFHDNPEAIQTLFAKDYVNSTTCDFVLYNGDMVSSFESEERLIQSVLAPSVASFASSVPLFFARGNHETRGAWAMNYSQYFPTSTSAPYYVFYDGCAAFIVLDAGEDKPDSDIEYMDTADYDTYRRTQAQWLKSVVESQEFIQSKVKCVFLHIPPKSNGWHGQAEVCRHFAPILNKADIDIMFCAHIHKYSLLEAGDTLTECNFPIICNPNRCRMEVDINPQRVAYKIVDKELKEIISNEIILK